MENSKNKTILKLLNGKYYYLPDYNQVLDPTITETFMKHADHREIPVQDVPVDRGILETRVSNLPQLIFEVSANCNLRCAYCVYNGNYINQRSLTPDNMDFDTACKGIDIVYNHLKDRELKEFAFGFYGGEPLLNVELIRQIIDYTRDRFTGWDLHYNMTTNLTLLKEDSLELLVKNNIALLISLDGDKPNHDAKRRFVNGNGTFDTVIRNLEKIRERDADYFRRKVGFSSVYSMDLSLDNQYRFFSEQKDVRDLRVRFNTVNTYNTSYYIDNPYDQDQFQRDFRAMLNRVLDKVRNDETLSGLDSYLYTTFMETGSNLKIRNYTELGGSCMFDDRLYLDSGGSFHICEKMNNRFSIGDVEKGFDFERMESLVGEFTSVVKTHCRDCSIRYLCKRCFVTFGGDGTFRIDPEFCQNQKESVVRKLEQYILWMEERQERQKNKGTSETMTPVSSGKSPKSPKYRFRQFVHTVRGPVNTAIIDQLKGNIFQVENWMVDAFEGDRYNEVGDFMDFAHEEGLIVEAKDTLWYPPTELDWPPEELEGTVHKTPIELHIEEGIELDPVLKKLECADVLKVYFYGKTAPPATRYPVEVIRLDKNIERCIEETTIDGNFPPVSHITYHINRRYNSCWGGKIAVKIDGSVRPCIHSHIILGYIHTDDVASILKKLREMWGITHDKIEKCKDCELKFVCNDCREFAVRKTGNLYSPPVNCYYDPHTGKWQE
jgi:uncharacterized protein